MFRGCVGHRLDHNKSRFRPTRRAMSSNGLGLGFLMVMIVVGCGYAGLTQQLWAARRDFEIMARSPTLIFVSTLGGFAIMTLILVQWRRRAEGGSLPCTTMAYTTPFGERDTHIVSKVVGNQTRPVGPGMGQ